MVPYSKKHSQVLLSQDIPAGWEEHAVPDSKTLFGQTNHCSSLLQYLTLPEYSLYFMRLFATEPEHLVFIREQPVFFLIIQLNNTLEFTLPGMAAQKFPEWSFNFIYAPDFQMETELKKNISNESFIMIVPEAFLLYFAKHFPSITAFHKKIKSGMPHTMLPAPKICPPGIIKKITELKQHGLDGLDIYFAEQLISQIFQLSSSIPYRKIVFDDEVVQRIYALKEFLQSHPQTDVSRDDMMKKFHLSAPQLNQGFVSVYNLTPFAFLKYLRAQLSL